MRLHTPKNVIFAHDVPLRLNQTESFTYVAFSFNKNGYFEQKYLKNVQRKLHKDTNEAFLSKNFKAGILVKNWSNFVTEIQICYDH